MTELPTPRQYRAERLSRRGEFFAWGSVVLVALGAALMRWQGFTIHWTLYLVGLPLLLTALGISLSNWMDRRTVLSFQSLGVDFRNGLRHTFLPWQEIRELRVLPAPWGKKVQVIGEHGYFHFFTLGEVKVDGVVKGRTGFPAGDKILRELIEAGQLRPIDRPKTSDAGSLYYARQ